MPRKPAKPTKKPAPPAAAKLPPGKLLPAPDGSSLYRLREQYRAQLEEVARATRRKKHAKERVASCEVDVMRASENRTLNTGTGQKATEVLVAALRSFEEKERQLKTARADLKAAQNAYLNHVDEAD